MRLPLILFLLSMVLASNAEAQVIDTVYGCNEFPSVDEVIDCAICSDNPFYGTTDGYFPTDPTNWCGTIENDQYIAFFSDASGLVSFEVDVFTSQTGEGIQIGLVDENNNVFSCIQQVFPYTGTNSYAFSVPPETILFLRIDGFAGDICEFIFTPLFGFNPLPPLLQVVNLPGQTIVDYIYNSCSRPSAPDTTIGDCVYSFDYAFNPENSGVVDIGFLQDRYREVFTWAPSAPIRAEVDRVLTLVEQTPGSICDSTLRYPYLSHFLDLDLQDPVEPWNYLNCNQQRYVHELEADGNLPIGLFEGGQQRYVIQAAGLHRRFPADAVNRYFRYTVRQNGTSLITNKWLTLDDYTDTLSLDLSLGRATITLYNDFNTPMEYAITALDPPTPWVPELECDFDNIEICIGEAFEADCRLANGPCSNTTECQEGLRSLLSVELIDRSTGQPTNFTVNASYRFDTELQMDINEQTIADLGVGSYRIKTLFEIDQRFEGFCALSDTVSFLLDFSIVDARDTVVLDTLELQPGTTLTIFDEAPVSDPTIIDAAGTYYAIESCTLYIQQVNSSVVVDLGEVTLCEGDCAFTPTGEQIACQEGTYSYLGSNDTTYVIAVNIDDSQPFEITETVYTCNETTGEWYVYFSWTGSQAPYIFDGVTYPTGEATVGPFVTNEPVSFALIGSSPCIDTSYISGSYICEVLSTQDIEALGFSIRELNPNTLLVTAASPRWRFQVTDVLGRVWMREAVTSAEVQLRTDVLPKGAYYLSFSTENKFATTGYIKK